jgi:hypothetical protein
MTRRALRSMRSAWPSPGVIGGADTATTHLDVDARPTVPSLIGPATTSSRKASPPHRPARCRVSVVTGEIRRFRPGSTTAQAFVPDGVNTETVGVFVDMVRACCGHAPST